MRFLLTIIFTIASLGATAQTVIDMHTGRVSGKTRDDYNYQAREAWQLREDSIAYNDCITRAFNYLHEDSLQAAQDHFEKALKLRPDAPGNAVVRRNIGRIFMARHQWRDAAGMFTKVLDEHPRDVEAREDRAASYIEAGLYDKALKDYDFLLVLRPDDEQYRLMHAIMLSHTGEKLEAIDELDAIIERAPDNAEAHLIRAGVYTELGNRGYARRDLDRAVALGIPKDDILDLYAKLK